MRRFGLAFFSIAAVQLVVSEAYTLDFFRELKVNDFVKNLGRIEREVGERRIRDVSKEGEKANKPDGLHDDLSQRPDLCAINPNLPQCPKAVR
jgi:hypothetical protein